jgi:hypothetical protein
VETNHLLQFVVISNRVQERLAVEARESLLPKDVIGGVSSAQ